MRPFLTFGLLRTLGSTGWDWLEETWHLGSGASHLEILTMMGTHQEPLWHRWNMSRAKGCPALGSPESHKSLRGRKDTLVAVTLDLDFGG